MEVRREPESGAAPSDDVAARASAAEDAKRNVRLRVKVLRREDGEPVAGAAIGTVLIEHGRGTHARFLTDEFGCVDLPVARDRTGVTVSVDPPGDALKPASIGLLPMRDDAPKELLFQLERQARPRTWVRVVAREDGRAIPAAQVLVHYQGRGRGVFDFVDDTETDSSGFAEVPMYAQPAQAIEVTAAGYATALAIVRVGAHDGRDHPAVVVLERSARVIGRLVDDAVKPLAGLRIVVTADTAALSQGLNFTPPSFFSIELRHVRSGESQEDGRFELDQLPAGVPLRVVAVINRFEDEIETDLTLAPGETRHVEWRIAASVNVFGRVFGPDGTPSRDAIVRLRRVSRPQEGPRAVIVEDDGTFAIEDARPGEWHVTATDDDLRLVAARHLTIESTIAPLFVELTLAPEVNLRGCVQFADGRPAPHVMARFESVDATVARRFALTEDDGTFVIGRVMQGRGTLTAATVTLELPSIPEHDVIVVIPDPAGGSAIRGRLRTRDGALEDRARVEARLRGEWEKPGAHLTRSSGIGVPVFSSFEPDRFELAPLVPGTWDLFASTPDGHVGMAIGIEVRSDEARTDVTIDLAPGAWATVHVVGTEEFATAAAPLPSLTLRARLGVAVVARQPLGRSGFSDLLVPAGRVTFELWRDESSELLASNERLVATGELFEVELRAVR